MLYESDALESHSMLLAVSSHLKLGMLLTGDSPISDLNDEEHQNMKKEILPRLSLL